MTLKTWVVTLTLPIVVSFAHIAGASDDQTAVLAADGAKQTNITEAAIQLARRDGWYRDDDDYRRNRYQRDRECRGYDDRKHRRGDYRECRYDDDRGQRREHRREYQRDIWFVDVHAANVRAKPRLGSYVIDTKYRCEPVRVQHPVRGGSWLKVRAHGTTGFMHASVLSRHAPRRCRHAELDVGQNQRG